ncbi:MAG TPA: sigma-70 family RNA polymerase sigma factor [Thermoleophilaceae bacterium]|nr:sigma-70 family RNA polymerase sigma factor [Thermoleophilaceae bacterium]
MEMPRTHIEGLIEEFGALMLATARRWSASDQDAEDAFQRAAERALRNNPDGSPDEVRAWLRTTVKNEALSIVRQRRRIAAAGPGEALEGPRLFSPQAPADTHVRAEQLERLRLGGQALRRLKPQEIRALQLQAEGYSYREIAAITGWSATKVNRCLAEGRHAFRLALDGIASGAECDRLADALAAFAAGDAAPDELAAVRSHLSTCLACRARLRHHRAAA